MDDAARLIAASPPHGTVVTAERQSAGRGRNPGSRWRSAPGANLLITLMLRQAATAAEPATVPLRVGCALAEVAVAWGLSPSIKWPNDLLVGGCKLAGVLCTATRGWLLVGVGMNCNQRSFPPDAGDATSVALCLGRSVDRARLEWDALRAMHRLMDDGDWLSRLRGRLAGVGGPGAGRAGGAYHRRHAAGGRPERRVAASRRPRRGSGHAGAERQSHAETGAEARVDRKLSADVGAGGRSCYLAKYIPNHITLQKG